MFIIIVLILQFSHIVQPYYLLRFENNHHFSLNTLLGDRLPEPLLAFLAGGGEALADRDGEGEADAGARRFTGAG